MSTYLESENIGVLCIIPREWCTYLFRSKSKNHCSAQSAKVIRSERVKSLHRRMIGLGKGVCSSQLLAKFVRWISCVEIRLCCCAVGSTDEITNSYADQGRHEAAPYAQKHSFSRCSSNLPTWEGYQFLRWSRPYYGSCWSVRTITYIFTMKQQPTT